MTSAARIDTHQHLILPAYRKLLDDRGLTAGGWPTPNFEVVPQRKNLDRPRKGKKDVKFVMTTPAALSPSSHGS
jgi:hypothetical protein